MWVFQNPPTSCGFRKCFKTRMDSFEDDPFEPSSSRDSEKVEEEPVLDLLEEGWFFGRFPNPKPRMSRCYSDPSPNIGQEEPFNQESSSTKKLLVAGQLVRAPSLPPFIGRDEKVHKKSSKEVAKLTRQLSDQSLVHKLKMQSCAENKERTHEKGSCRRKSKCIAGEPPLGNLMRTPSLPPCIGREEEIQENESDDISMSRLIRLAMPNSATILPPRRVCKGVMRISTMPKSGPPWRNPQLGGTNTVHANETRQPYPNQRKLQRSLSNLEFQQVQGGRFKDLGIAAENKGLRKQSIVDGFLGSQEKNRGNPDENKVRSIGYDHSEAWHMQQCSATPPIPSAQNSAEDMKAQLKFWARAVASNVR